ncbi:MAG TPA: MBL fold metallo-hydrolase [Pyrinomonadaceae bacterium]|nr:MBL fold metallo-hydrolase [Pyrinomonadaceae bacterium]
MKTLSYSLRPLALLFLVIIASPLAVFAQSENFEVVRVAEGVYATIRKDSPGLGAEANNVLIINDEDVIVVDANLSPSATREVLAALRKLTTKPVRYVVNTHWHDDHVIGGGVYREAFPNVEFIGHARTREYLPGVGRERREQAFKGAAEFVKDLQSLVEQNKSLTGNPLTEEERASYLNDIKIGTRFVAEGPRAEIVLPTVTVEERLTLHRGARVIEILHLGRGHTAGDLVVHLPKEGVVVTGDLVVWPVPYVGSEQSHIGEWAATLERLVALRPTVIVPGHGPVLRDDSYVKLLASMFASIRQQAREAFARGETLDEARRSVKLEEFRKQLAGESQFRRVLFRVYVVAPAVEAAYREASAKP